MKCPICDAECVLCAKTDDGVVVRCPDHGKQTILKDDAKDGDEQ